jgi:hypothetical protein
MLVASALTLPFVWACAAAPLSTQTNEQGDPPVVALPSQPTAMLELTVGTTGVGRDCKVLQSSGDPRGEELACRNFSRAGHEIRTDKDGRPIEYQKKFNLARSFLLQLEQAGP